MVELTGQVPAVPAVVPAAAVAPPVPAVPPAAAAPTDLLPAAAVAEPRPLPGIPRLHFSIFLTLCSSCCETG
jgi:hypothetical protein